MSRFRILFLEVLLALSFIGLVVLVVKSTRSGAKARWSALNPAAVRQLWASYGYVAPTASSFEELLKQDISLNAVRDSNSARLHEPELATFIRRFVSAYGNDSFDEFWEFRIPTGHFQMREDSESMLKGILDQAHSLDPSPTEALSVHASGGKDLLRKFWNVSIEVRKSGAKMKNVRHLNILCTNCIASVSLEQLRIMVYPPGAASPSLRSLIKDEANIGIALSTNVVNALPGEAAIIGDHKRLIDYVVVEIPIRTRAGASHPVFLSAYWDPDDACYIPAGMALPTTAGDRAFMIF